MSGFVHRSKNPLGSLFAPIRRFKEKAPTPEARGLILAKKPA